MADQKDNQKNSQGTGFSGGNNSGQETQNSGGISNRGFASMDEERQREIASDGGKAAHEQGTAHEFTSEEAREAGRKGGQSKGGDKKKGESQDGSKTGYRGGNQSGNKGGNQSGSNRGNKGSK
jgi:uncharacterized protein